MPVHGFAGECRQGDDAQVRSVAYRDNEIKALLIDRDKLASAKAALMEQIEIAERRIQNLDRACDAEREGRRAVTRQLKKCRQIMRDNGLGEIYPTNADSEYEKRHDMGREIANMSPRHQATFAVLMDELSSHKDHIEKLKRVIIDAGLDVPEYAHEIAAAGIVALQQAEEDDRGEQRDQTGASLPVQKQHGPQDSASAIRADSEEIG